MACYAGETKTTTDSVVGWHDLETPWDSVTGRSPLCELCRMVNDRLAALRQARYAFKRIGKQAPDESLGNLDYAGNADWNPSGDFGTILTECHTQLVNMTRSSPYGMVNAQGYRWWYVNAATVRSALNSALSGLDFDLQEDWKPIIVALRTALDSLSGASIQSAAWAERKIFVGYVARTIFDPNPVVSNVAISGPEMEAAAITPAYGGTSTYWEVALSSTQNNYGDRSALCPSAAGGGEKFGDIGVFYDWFNADGVSPDNASDPLGSFCSSQLGVTGWHHRSTMRKTYTITIRLGNLFPQPPLTAMNGKTIFWHVLVVDRHGGIPIVNHTVSPLSGSFVWSQLSGGTSNQVEIVVDGALDLPALDADASPLDYERSEGGLFFHLIVDTSDFSFCIDANGDFHG